MRALALLALALLTAFPAATGATYTYVAGGHEPNTGNSVMCSNTEVVVGGACLVDVPAATFTITVVDGLGNPVWFRWFGQQDSGLGTSGCGGGDHSFASVTATFPADCLQVAVFPDMGSFAGTITIE